jgi:hypothetical protein
VLVAPVIGLQLAPDVSQVNHWYVNVIDEPVQVPGLAVSVEPTVVVPLIVGGDVFGGPDCGVTAAVALEVAFVWPSVLIAVTWARSVKPMSPVAGA